MSVNADVVKFWITTIVYVGSALTLTVLCVHHLRKHYQDFHTEERKSVAHRRSKPEITEGYKLTGLATSFNVLFSTFHCYVLVFNLLLPFAYEDESLQFQKRICKVTIALSTSIAFPKLMVYYVFCLRLHIVYGGTIYAISVLKLKLAVIILTVWMFIITFSFIWYGAYTIDSSGDWELIFIHKDGIIYCESLVAPWFFLMWGVYDVGINLVFCYYFFQPIKDVMLKMQTDHTRLPGVSVTADSTTDGIKTDSRSRADSSKQEASGASRAGGAGTSETQGGVRGSIDTIKKTSDRGREIEERTNKLTRKMIAVGIKVTILSFALAISTMILSTMWVVFVINLFAFDDLINTLCLVLMTPYYPDKDFYHRLCKCCICCCDRNAYTYSSYKDEESETSKKGKAGKSGKTGNNNNNKDTNGDGDGDGEEERGIEVTMTQTMTISSTGLTESTATSGKSATSGAATSSDGHDGSSLNNSSIDVSSADTASAIRIGAHKVSPPVATTTSKYGKKLHIGSTNNKHGVNLRSQSPSLEGLDEVMLQDDQHHD